MLICCTSAVACSSDADKLTMLRADYAVALLNYQSWDKKCEVAEKAEGVRHMSPNVGPKVKTCRDTLYQWMTKRDLAERALNKFMK